MTNNLVHWLHACLTKASTPSFYQQALASTTHRCLLLTPRPACKVSPRTGSKDFKATLARLSALNPASTPAPCSVVSKRQSMADADKIISLNVGGVKFATSLETLTRVGPGCQASLWECWAFNNLKVQHSTRAEGTYALWCLLSKIPGHCLLIVPSCTIVCKPRPVVASDLHVTTLLLGCVLPSQASTLSFRTSCLCSRIQSRCSLACSKVTSGNGRMIR